MISTTTSTWSSPDLLGVAQYAASGREVGYRELGTGRSFRRTLRHRWRAKIRQRGCPEGQYRDGHAIQGAGVTDPWQLNPFRIGLLRYLTGMVRNLSGRVYEFSTLGVNNRIHAELLQAGAKSGEDLDGVARIHQPPTHAQLAGRVSCNREAVSRELGRLDKQGLLVRSRGRWEVPDMERSRPWSTMSISSFHQDSLSRLSVQFLLDALASHLPATDRFGRNATGRRGDDTSADGPHGPGDSLHPTGRVRQRSLVGTDRPSRREGWRSLRSNRSEDAAITRDPGRNCHIALRH